ncbi:MAG: hypothetical protein R6V00_07935 [Candidatus Aminicenantes bacterium]
MTSYMLNTMSILAGKNTGFVTRSIPQRGISLPFGLRSPLKRNHARSALKGIPHPLPSPSTETLIPE